MLLFFSQGEAYVPDKELVSIIIAIYRTHLSQALAVSSISKNNLNLVLSLISNLSFLVTFFLCFVF